MTRFAPFCFAISLLSACAPQSGTLTPPGPSDVTEPVDDDRPVVDTIDTEGDSVTYTVHFDGDGDGATLTCGATTYTAEFDSDGYAVFNVECGSLPYFNVVDNSDPTSLAEIVDNGDDTLVPESHFEVWLNGVYDMVLYPVTVNHDDGGRFPLCDVPQWNIDSGMPFGPLEAWGEDLCETSD